jgi:hypothetical protein
VGKLTRNQIAEPYLTNQNELKLIETKTFGNYGSVCLNLSLKISQSWNNVFLSQQISISSISQKYSPPNKAYFDATSN